MRNLPSNNSYKPIISLAISPEHLFPSSKISPIFTKFYTLAHPLIPANLDEIIYEDNAENILGHVALGFDEKEIKDLLGDIKKNKMSYKDFLPKLSEKAQSITNNDIERQVPDLILVNPLIPEDLSKMISSENAKKMIEEQKLDLKEKDKNYVMKGIEDNKVTYKDFLSRLSKKGYKISQYEKIFKSKKSGDNREPDSEGEMKRFSESVEKVLKSPEIEWLKSVYNQNCLSGTGANLIEHLSLDQLGSTQDIYSKFTFKPVQSNEENNALINGQECICTLENGSIKSLTLLNTLQSLIPDALRIESGHELRLPFLIQTKIEIGFDINQPKSLVGTAKISSIKTSMEVYREVDNKGQAIPPQKLVNKEDIEKFGKFLSYVNSNFGTSKREDGKKFIDILTKSANSNSIKRRLSSVIEKIVDYFKISDKNPINTNVDENSQGNKIIPERQNIFSSIFGKIINIFKSNSQKNSEINPNSTDQNIPQPNDPSQKTRKFSPGPTTNSAKHEQNEHQRR